jgi:hypothetical protein
MAKVILGSIMLLLLSHVLHAQHSATARVTASATIVSPIGTSKTSEFSFGRFTTSNNPGNIVIHPNSSLETYGGVTMVAGKANGEAAVFKVINSVYDYMVTLPNECMMIHSDGTQSMQLCQFDVVAFEEPGSGGYIEKLAIGATLNIQANQLPGEYQPATPFEVVINYN